MWRAIERMEDRTFLSAGTLDAGFGNLGRTATDLTSVSGVAADVANSIAIQSDGKYVVAGSSATVISQGILTRYNADGSLDTSFGAGGSVASSYFGGFQDVAVLPDGTIVATGQVNDVSGNSYFGVLKVTVFGLLDSSFGVNGLALADFTPGLGYESEIPHALTLQGTNIVVAGEGVFSSSGDRDMLVARFTSDGNLDNTFNGNGKQFVAFDLGGSDDDIAYDVAIDNNNKVLLAGSASIGDLDFAAARLTTTGSLDTTFDTDGRKTVDFGFLNDDEAFAVAVEPGGNIVLGGYTVSGANGTDDFALTRLNNLGAVLNGFGTNGLVTTEFGTVNEPSHDRILDLKIQGSTQVVVAGFSNAFSGVLPDQQFSLARYALSNGAIDTSLDTNSGNGGRVRTAFFADAVATANALVIDASGNYVAVGSSGGIGGITQNWALTRYLNNGTLDTSFGNQARVLTDQSFWNGISHDQAAAAITLSDGRIVVAGASSLFGGGTYGVLSCYLPGGQLDPTFGVGGEIASPYFAGGFQDLVSLPDGSILATGQVRDSVGNEYFGVLKVTPNGYLDQNFGIRGLAVADFGGFGFSYSGELPHALVLQGTNIVVAGEGISSFGDKDMLVARFSADGNLDNTFNSTGLQAVLFDLGGNFDDIAYDVTIDNSNKILVAGSADFGDLDFGIARLTNTGTLDTTFDTDGKKTIDFGFLNNDEAFSVAVEPGGNIILGGYTVSGTNGTDDFALTRLNNLGGVLAGFGTNGLQTTDFGTVNEPSNDRIMDLRLQGTQVVVAGFSAQFGGILPNQTFSLARYNLNDGLLDANLDSSSGNGGRVRASFFATTISTANAITFDLSGNYILVGSSGDGFLADNFALAKFATNGTISNAFGNQGRVLTDFSPVVGPNDSGTSTTIAADGHIIVAALSQSFFGTSGVIARYNSDGTLDQSFGSNGLVGSALFQLGFSDVVVLADNSILATGQILDTLGNAYFGVLKLDSHGIVDQTFGIRGLAVADFTPGLGYFNEIPHALTLQGQNIVVAGEGTSFLFDTDMLVARFTADGNLDNTFNSSGMQFVAFDLGGLQNDIAYDVAIDNNNKILLAGSADFGDLDFAAARLTTTGSLDATFDTDGRKTIDFGFFNNDEAFSVAVEAGGNIVLGGYTVSGSNGTDDFALTRLSNLGAVLSGFGTNGLVTTDFGTINEPANDRIQGIRLQGAQVVVAGYTIPTTGVLVFQQFAAARYTLSTGALDSTVAPDTGNGGRVTTDFFVSSKSAAQSIAVDANGNWVVVGSAGDGVFADNIALARYTDPPPTTVVVSSNASTFSEAGGTVIVTATLNVRSLVPVTVNLNFTGTATLNADYTRSSAQIVVPAGQLTGTVGITGIPDLTVEGNETVLVGIGAITNAANAGPTQVSLTELDANNAPPTDINLSNSSVAENQPNAVVGTLSAVDTAGDTHTFAIQAGGNGNLFTIVGNQLRVGATALNFEALGGSASVTIRATDQGNLFFNKVITITITDVNEAPTITAGQTFSIAENSAAATNVTGGPVLSTDPDTSAPNNTRNFSITGGNTGGAFSINSATGQIAVANPAALNFETTPSFTLQISLTDGGGATATVNPQNVTVNLIDVNEAPTITAGQTFSIAENSAANVGVGAVAATDPDTSAPNNTRNFSITGGNTGGAFSINSATGQISVANPAALNFETTPSFTLQISLTDGGGATATVNPQNVTVNLIDVNEAPTITAGQTFSIAENSAANVGVGAVAATDPDTSAPNNTRNFSITGGNTGGAFSINSATGQISVANPAALNFETTPSFTLQISLSDGGGATATVNPQNVTVNLIDVNEAPTITAGQTFSIAENSANNTSVGMVLASDPDSSAPNKTLTYNITGGNVSNAFAINSSTGQLFVNNVTALDFEANATFNLTIQVTDGGVPQQSTSQSVTVNLTNVNELPVVGNPGQAPTYRNKGKIPVQIFPSITVSDPDGSTDLGQVIISVPVIPRKKNPDTYGFGAASGLGIVNTTNVGGRMQVTITLNNGVTADQVSNFLRSITFSTRGAAGLKVTNRDVQIRVVDRQNVQSNLVTQNVGVSKR